MKNERKEELKDEMKNRISLALKDPILQQGFEIICKENAELKNKLEHRNCVDCSNHSSNLRMRNLDLEKENAELKKACDETQCLLDKQIEATYKLDKENSELKEQISTKDILIKELQEQKVYWKESSFDWRHKFFKLDKVKRHIKKAKQLTKAKDLLKQWLQTSKASGCDNINIVTDTEQFLNSEVEK